MLCAHTVRRLKPGTFDQFSEAFMPSEDDAPAGWVRFHMLRGLADENEVVSAARPARRDHAPRPRGSISAGGL